MWICNSKYVYAHVRYVSICTCISLLYWLRLWKFLSSFLQRYVSEAKTTSCGIRIFFYSQNGIKLITSPYNPDWSWLREKSKASTIVTHSGLMSSTSVTCAMFFSLMPTNLLIECHWMITSTLYVVYIIYTVNNWLYNLRERQIQKYWLLIVNLNIESGFYGQRMCVCVNMSDWLIDWYGVFLILYGCILMFDCEFRWGVCTSVYIFNALLPCLELK